MPVSGGRIFNDASLDGFHMKLKSNANVQWTDLGLEQFIARLKILDNTSIQVGIVEPEASQMMPGGRLTIAEAAYINEFGARAAGIPARHFIQGAITARKGDAAARRMLRSIIAKGDPHAALTTEGQRFAREMAERLYHGDFRKNKPSTVKRKGFNHPLLETGQLAEAISYRLVYGEQDDDEGGGEGGDGGLE